MTAAAFVLAGVGVVLIWSAVVGEDPREVFAGTFRGSRASAAKASAKAKLQAKTKLQAKAAGG